MMSKRKGMEGLFDGRHFDREIIVLCVRWYLRYKLSLRDLVEMMAERGLSLAHTTIMRWVRRFTPEFVKRWKQFAVPTGRIWTPPRLQTRRLSSLSVDRSRISGLIQLCLREATDPDGLFAR